MTTRTYIRHYCTKCHRAYKTESRALRHLTTVHAGHAAIEAYTFEEQGGDARIIEINGRPA